MSDTATATIIKTPSAIRTALARFFCAETGGVLIKPLPDSFLEDVIIRVYYFQLAIFLFVYYTVFRLLLSENIVNDSNCVKK